MKFPAMNKHSRRRVNIPELSGGMNLRDNPTQCNDNQLTNLLNMWYKDGTLRTRPGMGNLKNEIFDTEYISSAGDYYCKCKVHNDINRTDNQGEMEVLISCVERYSARPDEISPWQTVKTAIRFFWCSKLGFEMLPSIVYSEQEIKNYFVVRHSGVLYCFVKNDLGGFIHILEKGAEQWDVVNEEDERIHVPLLATHCKVMDSSFEGTGVESYNLLSAYYKMIFSTVNPNHPPVTVDDGYGNVSVAYLHEMTYHFFEVENYKDAFYVGKKITAKITDEFGKIHTHEFTIGEDGNGREDSPREDNLIMFGNVNGITFSYDDVNLEPAHLPEDATYIEDNMEITIPHKPLNKNLIFQMTQTEWFGGASAGLAGGTRLFLCGNTDDNEKALVCWSGLNKPLYFPENSYFYVGDTSESVTGFGKQSDMLVIFKENETWFTQYYQNTNITAEDLINQNVVDIQASAVYFPLVQINPNIGCPYPDTVNLCRNRLVWLGSGGKVYSLVSSNQYSERSIYVVSDMIQTKLRQEKLYNAFALDWDGYYCLNIGGHVYLMDYNSYGYIYAASHTKTEDANLQIPWYYWELPQNAGPNDTETFIVCDNDILDVCFAPGGDKIHCHLFGFENGKSTDETLDNTITPVKNLLQTKFFDFGEPNSYKNICSVGLSLGFNGGDEITVTFLTDGGEEQTGLALEGDADERTAGFTKSRILYPAICSAVRFGVKLECEGNMIIDGLNIDYRVLGRAR